MQNSVLSHVSDPREVLESAIDQKTVAIMTYLTDRRWHVAKLVFTELGANKLCCRIITDSKPRPINVRPEQPVGVSLKHSCGKIIFETKIVALEPATDTLTGGAIILAVPNRVEIINRRSYFRVKVHSNLKVKTVCWHRDQKQEDNAISQKPDTSDKRYWQGTLIDISAGGIQLAIDIDQKPLFKKGQFVTIRFTPLPYSMPLMFHTQIRNLLPTADNKSVCLGLQIVGLEASPEGHEVLKKICEVVEQYYNLSQAQIKNQTPQEIVAG